MARIEGLTSDGCLFSSNIVIWLMNMKAYGPNSGYLAAFRL